MIVNDIFFYMVYNTVVFFVKSEFTVILYRISSAIVII